MESNECHPISEIFNKEKLSRHVQIKNIGHTPDRCWRENADGSERLNTNTIDNVIAKRTSPYAPPRVIFGCYIHFPSFMEQYSLHPLQKNDLKRMCLYICFKWTPKFLNVDIVSPLQRTDCSISMTSLRCMWRPLMHDSRAEIWGSELTYDDRRVDTFLLIGQLVIGPWLHIRW